MQAAFVITVQKYDPVSFGSPNTSIARWAYATIKGLLNQPYPGIHAASDSGSSAIRRAVIHDKKFIVGKLLGKATIDCSGNLPLAVICWNHNAEVRIVFHSQGIPAGLLPLRHTTQQKYTTLLSTKMRDRPRHAGLVRARRKD